MNATDSWSPSTMHAAMLTAPCADNSVESEPNPNVTNFCAYVTGGLTDEGYYDNNVHRFTLSAPLDPARMVSVAAASDVSEDLVDSPSSPEPYRTLLPVVVAVLAVLVVAIVWSQSRAPSDGKDKSAWAKLDPSMRCAVSLVVCLCVLSLALAAYMTLALMRLSHEFDDVKSNAPRCSVDSDVVGRLWEALGLRETSERWSHFETLLRLAARESQFSYGGFGGSHDPWRGLGSGRDRSYDRGYGLDRDYGYYGGYGGYGYGSYGGYGGFGPLGEEPDLVSPGDTGKESPAAQERELAALPTTQGMSCRSPRCDRNATLCSWSTSSSGRSLSTPYGCCSDYMMLMLKDVTDWLDQQEIPYFITYGTLLGAVRENDIIPYTQDMDIVVDRAFWPQLHRGLEAAEFFGGRRYLFGVDQWEERVSRVCADWDGFAASVIGGAGDSDRFTRNAEFHLDIYASDWWQITDMHLVDCVEPLGTRNVQIRGLNFSAPARPRACVEKLYGVEWRTPKRGLAGVN